MKKLLSFSLCLLLLLGLWIPAFAAETLPLIVDQAKLLSREEAATLGNKAQQIQNSYSTDVVILTIDSLDGWSAPDYANTFFDQNGYGYGSNANGILFLLAMEEREWYISTCGDTIYAVTDHEIQWFGEAAIGYFGDGEYYTGFDRYLDELEDSLIAYQAGVSLDGYPDDSYYGYQENMVYYEENSTPSILLSLIIGIAAAAIAVITMRSSMNTKRQQRGAASYIKNGSFHLRSHQDLFLYSSVTKVRRQQNTGSSSRGGGSSVHRSSGGRRHGGGGGRF